MIKQVINVDVLGMPTCLLMQGGDTKGTVNVLSFGDVQVSRITDIKWDSNNHAWYVEFLMNPVKGQVITIDFLSEHGKINHLPQGIRGKAVNNVILLETYEYARELEVFVVNEMLKDGVNFDD